MLLVLDPVCNMKTQALSQIGGNQRDMISTMCDPELDPGKEKGHCQEKWETSNEGED